MARFALGTPLMVYAVTAEKAEYMHTNACRFVDVVRNSWASSLMPIFSMKVRRKVIS